MRARGRVTRWNDDRGFGFITPDEGGRGVFVHIKAMPRGRRPLVGDAVEFTVATDDSGRPEATDVRPLVTGSRADRGRPASAPPPQRRASPPSTRGLVGAGLTAVAALAVHAVLVVTEAVPAVLLLAQLGACAVSFGLYARDKSAARTGTWRVPEATLHLVDLLGGWPGGLVARHVLRHKTRKQPFQRNFWLTVALHVVLVVVIAVEGSDLERLLSG